MASHISPPHLLPPFVPIQGVVNCRYLSFPSAETPWLYCSGDISNITPEGISKLQTLQIKTTFDFWTPGDFIVLKHQTPSLSRIKVINVPLFFWWDIWDKRWTQSQGSQVISICKHEGFLQATFSQWRGDLGRPLYTMPCSRKKRSGNLVESHNGLKERRWNLDAQ